MSHDVQPLQVLDVADILPGLILPLFLAVPGLVPAGVADGGEGLEPSSSTGQEQGSGMSAGRRLIPGLPLGVVTWS